MAQPTPTPSPGSDATEEPVAAPASASASASAPSSGPGSFELGDDDLATAHPLVRGLIVVVAAAATVAVGYAHRASPLTAVLLVGMTVALGALSFVDVAEQRLPNKITLPLGAASIVVVLIAGIVDSRIGSALGAIGIGLLFAVVLLFGRFGMGDVKLALPIGTVAGWFGYSAVMTTILAASISGAAVALVLLAIHRRRSLTFGFGPFLAIGSVAGMLAAVGG